MTEKRFTLTNRSLREIGNDTAIADDGVPCTQRFVCNLLNELTEENEQLKQQINKLEAQLYCPFDSICIKCNNEYLVQKEYFYVSKCKKGHEQCSKEDVKYCEDFEVKELQE